MIFGDGIFGKKLEAPAYIEVSYVVTNGKNANGINSLNFSGKLTSGRSNLALTSGVSLLALGDPAAGGADIESIDSIKKYGPKVHGSQNRAVTADDYETLIPSVFPETEAVSCFGGEELTPPRFGQVFCAVKPTNGSYLSNALKENLKNAVKKYNVAGISLDITDLKYLYIEPNISVYYDCNAGGSKNDIINAVMNAILEYLNSEDLVGFGGRFKFSKFQCLIDGADPSITSNITSLRMRRDLRVALNSFTEYEICFGNCMFVKNCEGHNIRSSAFNVSGIQGHVYLSDKPDPNDHSKGTMFLFRLMSPTNPVTVKENIGTIDYEHGEIKLAPINITDTEITRDFPLIEIDTAPCSNDILGSHDLYLQLGDGDGDGSATDGINVDAYCDDVDPVSSYGGNKLVRGEVHYGCNTDGTVTDVTINETTTTNTTQNGNVTGTMTTQTTQTTNY